MPVCKATVVFALLWSSSVLHQVAQAQEPTQAQVWHPVWQGLLRGGDGHAVVACMSAVGLVFALSTASNHTFFQPSTAPRACNPSLRLLALAVRALAVRHAALCCGLPAGPPLQQMNTSHAWQGSQAAGTA